jgi:hypothetical protein
MSGRFLQGRFLENLRHQNLLLMSKAAKVLARCKSLAGDNSTRQWRTAEDAASLLHAFRPDGEGVDAIMEGVVRGEEVLPRLKALYAATSATPKALPYPLPAHQAHRSLTEIEETVQQQLDKLREIVQHDGDAKAIAMLAKQFKIQHFDQKTRTTAEGDRIRNYLNDVLIDFRSKLAPVDSDALLLKEAIYSFAPWLAVRDYVLWPLYRDSSPIEEPFGPAFHLWEMGCTMDFVDDYHVGVHFFGRR